MTHRNEFRLAWHFMQRGLTVAAAVALLLWGQMAVAQGLSYQKANDIAPNIFPATALDTSDPVVDTDNLWGLRQDFGTLGSFSTPEVWQAGITEDVPELTQVLTGLTPNTEYDLYAAFWTDDDENWTIRAGTTSGNLTLYSFNGNHRSQPVEGATVGLTAGAALWDSPPPPTDNGTIFTEPRNPDPPQPFDDPLIMLLGDAGRVTSNGSGEISVFVDDLPMGGGPNRTWFDGIAYRPANDTPVALTASVNRDTGAISVANDTGTSFQITEVFVDSLAGGINAAEWTPINDTDPTWTINEPVDPDNTPFATVLHETGGNNFALASSGSLSVGNVWNKSPFEDVRVYLTLADGTLAAISPEYTGTGILQGDFDVDGDIDLGDYETLLSVMHTTVAGTTNVERHVQGDFTANGAVNFADFQGFRAAFDEANGAGSFAQMASQVPEPGTLAMLFVMGALALGYARRRVTSACVALIACLLMAGSSQAVTFLKVDVDARAGDGTGVPAGPNTVDGFSSYTMTPATTGALSTSMGTVDGFTITLTSVNSAGSPVGVFDDRDRTAPTTTPTLNQLYDDFIFSDATATGDGGGIDMAIDSGGALMPNTSYVFTLYSFDVSSTGVQRTADWLDGNAGDALVLSSSFIGTAGPTSDEQYRFVGSALTDGSGNLLLRARETTVDTHGIFINGFEISDDFPPEPVELTLEINTTTGAVRIVNNQEVSFDMSYYEIRSASGSVNTAGWVSFDDGEGGGGGEGDHNQDGVVNAADYVFWRDAIGGTEGYDEFRENFGGSGGSDPVGSGWDEVPSSTANIVSELNLQSMDTFDPTDSASLGDAFSIGGTEDIQFFYAGPADEGLRLGNIVYVTSGSGAVAAIPEPATIGLLAIALLGLGLVRKRR